jgi:opacity protein-like surface antigen
MKLGKGLLASVALAAVALVAPQASAADIVDPVTGLPIYVSLFGGASHIAGRINARTTVSAFEYAAKFKTGYILGGAIGVKWNDMIRTEIELSHAGWKTKNVRGNTGAIVDGYGAKSAATYLLGNVWLDWRNESPLTPYVGGGVGMAWAKASPGDASYAPTGTESGFAFQLGAGLKYTVSDNIDVDLGYRFKGMESMTFKNVDPAQESFKTKSWGAHNVQLGLTFRF